MTGRGTKFFDQAQFSTVSVPSSRESNVPYTLFVLAAEFIRFLKDRVPVPVVHQTRQTKNVLVRPHSSCRVFLPGLCRPTGDSPSSMTLASARGTPFTRTLRRC